MKKITLFLIVIGLFTLISCDKKPQMTDQKNSEMDKKVEELLKKMTLEEKIGQMTLYTSDMDQTGAFIRKGYEEDIKAGKVGAIFNAYGAVYTRKLQEMAINNTRLKIPLLFGYDVIHGHRTIFPVPLAEASSWDLEAIEKSAKVAALEASAEGLHWTFAPMCDIARDPRWGRMVEGAGEDTYLGSLIARARVRGFQGKSLKDNNTILACVKHFAAYGAAQAGRDYNSVDMSERMLREVYLPPYQAAIQEGAGSVMTSFNDLNGIPATANKFLMTEVLRNEWNFKGFVVTDYTSIMELMFHGVAGDTTQASQLALRAGVDMDMQAGFYQKALAGIVQKNPTDEKLIDEAVRRILKIKFELGLFDDPYLYCSEEREKTDLMSATNLETALEVAKKSIVLLKNQNSLLPLDKNIKTLAVIGPLADNKRELIGSWSAAGDWNKSISLLQGIKAKLPKTSVLYAKGCNFNDDSTAQIQKAFEIAKKADVIVLAIGEAAWMSGEASSRSNIDLPGVQQQLAEAVYKTGKPVVVVLMNGRPLTINWIDKNIPAILETWFLGTQTGYAIADVLFGDYNPSAKLPVTFPRSVGQIPIFYNSKNTGRPFDANNKYTSKYLDIANEPLYPFGFGLSYTTFEYSDLTLSTKEITSDDSLLVSITIKNTGKYTGTEVVQLYIRDLVASVSRPVKELKGFQKITLQSGAEKTITFKITADQLSFYQADMSYGYESGEFTVFIGGNSRDTKDANFILK
jgi:beta-glucosidase